MTDTIVIKDLFDYTISGEVDLGGVKLEIGHVSDQPKNYKEVCLNPVQMKQLGEWLINMSKR